MRNKGGEGRGGKRKSFPLPSPPLLSFIPIKRNGGRGKRRGKWRGRKRRGQGYAHSFNFEIHQCNNYVYIE